MGNHTSNTWIDFKALRAHLDFEQVLLHYKVEVKRKGNQHLGFCPLPNHNGKKNSPSFSANLERGIFRCFGACGAKGNVLEFAALMEGVPLNDGVAFRELAIRLQARFCPELGGSRQAGHVGKPESKSELRTPPSGIKNDAPKLVNAPLDFELKGLDSHHPYLLNRGFTQQTIDHFGLGFCSRGYFKDRVVIPLHNHTGKLIGYGGRVVDDAAVTASNPRYRLPGERERDGKVYAFFKSLFLYNGFRLQPPLDRLFIVESFTGVWWLFQNELTNVVGTMGSDCSERQAELIVSLVKPDGQVWVMTDGDPAGEQCASDILKRVAPFRSVRWARLEDGLQPTDLSGHELKCRLLH